MVNGSNGMSASAGGSPARADLAPTFRRWRGRHLSQPWVSSEYRSDPLFVAVARADVAAVRECIASGNAQVAIGDQAPGLVTWAAASGNVEIVGLVLEAGADPNAAGNCSPSALHIAAARGDVKVASMLLDHGADPNARVGRGGPTPLEYALLLSGNADMARLLVSRGARFPPDGPVPMPAQLGRELARIAAERRAS